MAESNARVDPELTRQLRESEKADETVSGIIVLKPSAYAAHAKGQAADIADDAEELAKRVLERVNSRVRDKSVKTNILRNLGTVIFQGKSEFVRELIDQPEVESASANLTAEDPMIRPLNNLSDESKI